ncbi:MAG: hypothetical protein GF398_13805 [Chitinivibrionales bacterium]|nr:hypothetical protein [Chitinivibrionales bacterium]
MNLFTELLTAFLPGQDGFVFMWVLAVIALLAALLILDRFFDIRSRTDVDAPSFADKIKQLIEEHKMDEAYQLCLAGKRRALPRIIGSGLQRAAKTPQLIRSSMEEETMHMIPILEKRVDFLLMLGNISTLLGLMGTIYGLILSFAAVAQPNVAAVDKSSMLASGISTAMNTTLMGLMISVPCILVYSMLRAKIDRAVQEIDRYAVSVLKVLTPFDMMQKNYKVSSRRLKQEVDTEPNIAPMMNLMVILIPLLLTSAEFVKIGAIELKLPKSQLGGGGGGASEKAQQAKLNLGIVITEKGFNLFHYFKSDDSTATEPAQASDTHAEIPKNGREYDFAQLNKELADVKRQALLQIIRSMHPGIPDDASLIKLYTTYAKNDFSGIAAFEDHESVKIVAEDKIPYQVVVSVMDAARGFADPNGKVTMFPNVSLAGGIIQ